MNFTKRKMMIGSTTFFLVATTGLEIVQPKVTAYADTLYQVI